MAGSIGQLASFGYRSTGHAMQQAETRPAGALLSFWLSDETEARLEISTASGALVYSRSVDGTRGVNRLSWNLRPGGDADEESFPPQMMVLPGTYTVAVQVGDDSDSATLRVVQDPRSTVSTADMQAKQEALKEMVALSAGLTDARDELRKTMAAVEMVLRTLDEGDSELRTQGTALQGALREAMERLFTGPVCSGLCRSETLSDPVRTAVGALASAEGAPSGNEQVMMAKAREAARAVEVEVRALMGGDVARYRDALRAAGYTPFGSSEQGE